MLENNQKLKFGLIGKDGRTAAIERALKSSPIVETESVKIISDGKAGPEELFASVSAALTNSKFDIVVVGPEEPLASGIVDMIEDKFGIPCIGPRKKVAQLESSKAFTRELLEKYGIPGNPQFRVFKSLDGIEDFLYELQGFVIKPDGLTGGKGVMVSDVHLFSIPEAIEYCREVFREGHPSVVVEEKLDGEEFSLMSFCDGITLADMPPVQDHKRVGEGDTGSNTGGMGSYSCEDHSLPFLNAGDLDQASRINREVAKAVELMTGEQFKGILYGGFIVTAKGVRLIEYNVRFGDPEALNVLSILKTDFAQICVAIAQQKLSDLLPISFSKKATVCKYVVPEGYPDDPVKGERIEIPDDSSSGDSLRVYKAAVDDRDSGLYLTGSRAVAFVGIGEDIYEAELVAEEAASNVKGPVIHRKDIGTLQLIQRRIDHVRDLSEKTNLSA